MTRLKKLSLIFFMVSIFIFAWVSPAMSRNNITVQMWELTNWDPSVSYGDGPLVFSNIYETLLLYDEGKLIPVLATSFESSKDGKVWTFKLRKGVKFHNGEQFNAQAVKYSFDRTIKMAKGPEYIFANIKEIKVINDYTVQIIAKNAQPVDLIVSSYYGAFILPPKLTEEKGTEWFEKGNASGTGPYKLKSYEKGIGAVLGKFDDYWGGWKPNQFDTAIYKIVNETSTAVQLLKKGEMDIITKVPVDVRPQLANDPDIEILYGDSLTTIRYDIHNQRAPTDDVNVRRAICHAINTDEMREKIMGPEAVKATGPIPYTMWGYDANLKTYEYDIEKAKAYMQKSKYADQLPVKLTIAAYEEYTQPMAVYIQSALKKIGIEAEIDTTNYASAWDMYMDIKKCPHMTILYWWLDYPVPSSYMRSFFKEDTYYNWSYYHNPEYEKIVIEAQANEATNRKKTIELFSTAQQILLDDVAALFLTDLKETTIKRKEIKGFRQLALYKGAYWIYKLYK